jgi:ubiquinone/menaquinone biosynthesis C-methylase UbiE
MKLDLGAPVYDRIGAGYVRHRRADPRLADRILSALDLPRGSLIADLGAGTGSYSSALADRGLRVVAIDPSRVMRDQRRDHPRVNWIAGCGESIPLADRSVDGVVSVLAIHHFASAENAFAEMSRVAGAGPIVIFTLDPREGNKPWLAEYFPGVWEDARLVFPPIDAVARLLAAAGCGEVHAAAFALPPDLEDRFLAAGWRQPEIYLDEKVRASMSGFALADPTQIAAGLRRLQSDLESGLWGRKHGRIRTRRSVDWGYRLLFARTGESR